MPPGQYVNLAALEHAGWGLVPRSIGGLGLVPSPPDRRDWVLCPFPIGIDYRGPGLVPSPPRQVGLGLLSSPARQVGLGLVPRSVGGLGLVPIPHHSRAIQARTSTGARASSRGGALRARARSLFILVPCCNRRFVCCFNRRFVCCFKPHFVCCLKPRLV